jgi:LmbE family N-acetylglucosaminyl deacetylase
MVVVAHPDDETVGSGSRLPLLRDAVLVHVTDGAPRDLRDAAAAGCATREEYSRVRRQELGQALKLAGIPESRAWELGCVDQEASLNLARLACGIAEMVREVRPDVVLTHPYEGGHPDHDATAFAVHAACRILERQGWRAPTLVEMTSYHNRGGFITPCEFLPCEGPEPATVLLSDRDREFKRRLIDCYRTQWNTLRQFPLELERFRPAPRYEFTRPPHDGVLFYEMFEWGMTGARFAELAGRALSELEIASAV